VLVYTRFLKAQQILLRWKQKAERIGEKDRDEARRF